MLFTLLPVPKMPRPITINHFTKSMLQIILIVSFIGFAFWPDELPLPMHLIIQPTTFILTIITVSHDTLSTLTIIPELSHVARPIRADELPFTVLFVVMEPTLKPCTIRPSFLPSPISHIILPLTLIHNSTTGCILPITMSFIISPLTKVDVPIGVIQSSGTFSLAVVEFPTIGTGIREVQLTVAMFLPIVPLSKVVTILIHFNGVQHVGVGVQDDFRWWNSLIDPIFQFENMAWEFRQGCAGFRSMPINHGLILCCIGLHLSKWIGELINC